MDERVREAVADAAADNSIGEYPTVEEHYGGFAGGRNISEPVSEPISDTTNIETLYDVLKKLCGKKVATAILALLGLGMIALFAYDEISTRL